MRASFFEGAAIRPPCLAARRPPVGIAVTGTLSAESDEIPGDRGTYRRSSANRYPAQRHVTGGGFNHVPDHRHERPTGTRQDQRGAKAAQARLSRHHREADEQQSQAERPAGMGSRPAVVLVEPRPDGERNEHRGKQQVGSANVDGQAKCDAGATISAATKAMPKAAFGLPGRPRSDTRRRSRPATAMARWAVPRGAGTPRLPPATPGCRSQRSARLPRSRRAAPYSPTAA